MFYCTVINQPFPEIHPPRLHSTSDVLWKCFCEAHFWSLEHSTWHTGHIQDSWKKYLFSSFSMLWVWCAVHYMDSCHIAWRMLTPKLKALEEWWDSHWRLWMGTIWKIWFLPVCSLWPNHEPNWNGRFVRDPNQFVVHGPANPVEKDCSTFAKGL